MSKITTVIISIIIVVFLGINFLFQPSQLHYISNSTITGLAMMRAMANETISYEDAIVTNKPTLIEFYADWCTTCQSMSPVLKHLKENYEQKVNFVMINIDAPENKELIETYNVSGVPQWNILSKQGKNTEQLIGKVPESILESSLLQMNI